MKKPKLLEFSPQNKINKRGGSDKFLKMNKWDLLVRYTKVFAEEYKSKNAEQDSIPPEAKFFRKFDSKVHFC